jgi:outer membrane protein W
MRRRIAAIATVALLSASPAMAQTSSTITQADVTGSIGWLNVDKSDLSNNQSSNDWYNRSVYGGAAAGWYWTDHLKTEVEAGVSSRASLLIYGVDFVNGSPLTRYSRYSFATTRLGVSQQYQFLRNAWVHPFVGAGVDVIWEQTDRTEEVYPLQGGRGGATFPRQTDVLTRPFLTLGLKGYFNARGFVRTDLKLVFDNSVDEALFRFGIGVDF